MRVFSQTVVLLSKNRTCARPGRNATPSEHFLHSSHCTLHTPHSTLHTCTHLIRAQLFSSHFMSSHMSAKFFLAIFTSSEHSSTCSLQPLYTEKHTVSCSGFLPNTSPMPDECSHYHAFCSTTYTSMQPLQCDSHPRVAEHQGRTDYALKRSKPHLHAAFALTAAPARAVRALERAVGPAAGVLGFPHVARGYRQGVVRRNISPEACRDLVETRMLAERMERSFSEHCSQVLFRIPPVLLLQPQMYWAPCTCVAAVGTWTRWPPAGTLGPHAPFRAHPVPFRNCWCLPRAGQGVQGSTRACFHLLVWEVAGDFHLLVWEVAGD